MLSHRSRNPNFYRKLWGRTLNPDHHPLLDYNLRNGIGLPIDDYDMLSHLRNTLIIKPTESNSGSGGQDHHNIGLHVNSLFRNTYYYPFFTSNYRNQWRNNGIVNKFIEVPFEFRTYVSLRNDVEMDDGVKFKFIIPDCVIKTKYDLYRSAYLQSEYDKEKRKREDEYIFKDLNREVPDILGIKNNDYDSLGFVKKESPKPEDPGRIKKLKEISRVHRNFNLLREHELAGCNMHSDRIHDSRLLRQSINFYHLFEFEPNPNKKLILGKLENVNYLINSTYELYHLTFLFKKKPRFIDELPKRDWIDYLVCDPIEDENLIDNGKSKIPFKPNLMSHDELLDYMKKTTHVDL